MAAIGPAFISGLFSLAAGQLAKPKVRTPGEDLAEAERRRRRRVTGGFRSTVLTDPLGAQEPVTGQTRTLLGGGQ